MIAVARIITLVAYVRNDIICKDCINTMTGSLGTMWRLLLFLAPALAFDITTIKITIENELPYGTISRIGSFPGEDEVKYRIDLESSRLAFTGVPSRYSETVLEINDTANLYQDTFYWEKTFSVQQFQGKAEENIIGFARDSDIWKQFVWMEICPQQLRIVLHRSGNPLELQNHHCGYGEGAVDILECEANVEPDCLLPSNRYTIAGGTVNNTNVRIDWFDSAQRHDATVVLKNFPVKNINAEIPDNSSLPMRINGADLQVYGVYIPEEKQLHIFPEYVAKHTHSNLGLIFIEALLVFYLHFVSDKNKDYLNCKWTYIPAFFGNMFGVLAMSSIYHEFGLKERIYHSSVRFRLYNDHNTLASLCFAAVLASSLFSVVILSLPKLCRERPWKVHVGVLYEFVLQFPVTLYLIGGGRENLMNLLFTFLVSAVVIGSRVRDGVSFYKVLTADEKKYDRLNKGFYVLLALFELSVAVLYIIIILKLYGYRRWKICLCFPLSRTPLLRASLSPFAFSSGASSSTTNSISIRERPRTHESTIIFILSLPNLTFVFPKGLLVFFLLLSGVLEGFLAALAGKTGARPGA